MLYIFLVIDLSISLVPRPHQLSVAYSTENGEPGNEAISVLHYCLLSCATLFLLVLCPLLLWYIGLSYVLSNIISCYVLQWMPQTTALCIVHCAHTAVFVVLEYSLPLSFSESLRYLWVIPYTANFNDPPYLHSLSYADFMEYQTGFSTVFHMTSVIIENTK